MRVGAVEMVQRALIGLVVNVDHLRHLKISCLLPTATFIVIKLNTCLV